MPKYQSKPREVEAWQFRNYDGEETTAYPQWLLNAVGAGTINMTDCAIHNGTHDSSISFKETDWIMFNGPDDIYPCTDEEFQKRYEEVPS